MEIIVTEWSNRFHARHCKVECWGDTIHAGWLNMKMTGEKVGLIATELKEECLFYLLVALFMGA